MKQIIGIVIGIIIILFVAKVLLAALPIIIVAGAALWLYLRYKTNKRIKEFNDNIKNQYNRENNMSSQETYYNKDKQEEIYKGPIIDVDYEETDEK